MLATLGAQARWGAAAARPSVDKNVRRFMSYPLFAICDDRGSVAENLGHALHHFGGVRKMWTTFGRIARKRILFVANELHTDALAGESQSRRRHDEEQLFAT
ncbi:MAG TPA: hypothetical protein VK542_05470 [Gemmatimonadaceae bacterium]|nr:hypothetical protein [Gemmatimonadaceae bacterium]